MSPPPPPTPRAAIAVAVCNGTDYHNNAGVWQIARAILLACSLRTRLPLVALTYNVNPWARKQLALAGFRVEALTDDDVARTAMLEKTAPIPMSKWPRANQSHSVQTRRDLNCTCTKLHAWRLTEYDALLMSDVDVVFTADPLPWLTRQ